VDDDPLNRRLLAKHLEDDGHGIAQFDNGFSALAAFEAAQPVLVLLDIDMPGLDGIEVLERLKDDPHLRQTPVIMISSVEDTDRRRRALRSPRATLPSSAAPPIRSNPTPRPSVLDLSPTGAARWRRLRRVATSTPGFLFSSRSLTSSMLSWRRFLVCGARCPPGQGHERGMT
jgi:CheY-like chemotaxis protein